MSFVTLEDLELRGGNGGQGVLTVAASTHLVGITLRRLNVGFGNSSCIQFYNNIGGSFEDVLIEDVQAHNCGTVPGATADLQFGSADGGPTRKLRIRNSRFYACGDHEDKTSCFGIDLGNVQDALLENVEADHNGSTGVNIQNGCHHIVISGGSLHDNGQSPNGDRNGLAIGGFGRGSENILVEDVDIYSNRNSNVEIATTGDDAVMIDVTLRHDHIHDGFSNGVQVGGGHKLIRIEDSIIDNNAEYGVVVYESRTTGSPEVVLTGNTIQKNGSTSNRTANLFLAANSTSLSKNTITNSPALQIVVPEGYKIESDNNRWTQSDELKFSWHGVQYNLDGWRAHSNLDLHSTRIVR